MKLLDLFTHQHICDVLKKAFPTLDDSKLLLSADKCKANENFTIFSVRPGGSIEQKYVLVKIPKISEPPGQQGVKNSKVACPVFVLEDNNKECYGAFEYEHGMENFISPVQNNIECLKLILQELAEHQALDLVSSEADKPSEWNLKDITDKVISLDFFKDLNKATAQESVESLQLDFNNLISGSNLLVRSIGCPATQNVYVNQDKSRSLFLKVSSSEIVPPAYDALVYIFALSDDKFRQEHFENLVLYYFNSLTKFLQKLESNLADEITRFYCEHQVKVLLPIIKFQIASSILNSKRSQKLQEILTNILRFLKYPLVNQEDVYEVTKTKIRSSDYDLLHYSLVGISEKNGHLGEYYHLEIRIKTQGKVQELQLFAKFLRNATELMQEIVANGPAKKEEFFYQTLIPLFSKHGLDSLLDFATRCYLSRANWLTVLDDLTKQGYVSLKPNEVLNYEALRILIKNLANFHSCTLLLEEILSKESGRIVRLDQDLQDYEEIFKDSLLVYEDNHFLKGFYDSALEALYHVLEKFPEVTKKLNGSPEDIRARVKNAFVSVFSKVRKSDTLRNVLNHCDVYGGNLLVKFGEDKVITKGMFVDFQIIRYVPAGYDLMFFLFENTTKATRDKYLKVLLEEYYQSVCENIRQFNFDPELVLPKKAFDENIKFMSSAGVMSAFTYGHIVHTDSDFRIKLYSDQETFDYYFNHRTELVDLSWKTEHYRNIMKGLVEDIVDIIEKEF